MDTRNKIIGWDQARPVLDTALAGDGVLVAGCFDPLLSIHAARLRELAVNGHPLIVIVVDPPQPVLDTRARAELVAALAVVDHVVLPPEDQRGGAAWLPAEGRLYREDGADLERRAALIRHVHARSRFG